MTAHIEEKIEEKIDHLIETKKEKREKKMLGRLWILWLLLLVIGGIGVTGIIAYGKSFDYAVLPGVHIGSIPIGNMNQNDLFDLLERMNGRLSEEGVRVRYEDGPTTTSFVMYPTLVAGDTVYDLVSVNADAESQRLLQYGKNNGVFMTGLKAMSTRILQPSLQLEAIVVDEAQMDIQIDEALGEQKQVARDANIRVLDIISDEEVTFEIVTSSIGYSFDVERLISDIKDQWTVLEFPDVRIHQIETRPTVKEEDVNAVADQLATQLAYGDLELTYIDPHTEFPYDWNLTQRRLADWIEVQKGDDNEVTIGVSQDAVHDYIKENIEPKVNVEPVNARFEVSDTGKVKEFEGSRPGVMVDHQATYAALSEQMHARFLGTEAATSSMGIVTVVAEPDISTAEVNDLGITEVLGVGYSNFSGSPPNRVANVQFAITQKLDGYLIKPGEEFSMIDALKPFTLEAGYLSELVIKGDEIKPEVGGGLCQVGSTMFRAAMNSGLPITERRNHSLVVNYYNDHRNNLPGTDATIYDPAPDFKFLNDTGHYILITTAMNKQTGDLWFTLWGTGDGRKGYYTEPKVLEWIPTGPERVTKTTSIAPGKKECQSAHIGAVTTFTYVVENPDGTTEEREFRSHYRPLPKICLLGVTEEELAAGEDGEETGVNTTLEEEEASASETGEDVASVIEESPLSEG